MREELAPSVLVKIQQREQKEDIILFLLNLKEELLTYRQGRRQSTAHYYKCLKKKLSILESYGGQIHDPEAAAPASTNIHLLETAQMRDDYMRNRTHGTLLLRNADPYRFKSLLIELANSYGQGRDLYPTSLEKAYQMLLSYQQPY